MVVPSLEAIDSVQSSITTVKGRPKKSATASEELKEGSPTNDGPVVQRRTSSRIPTKQREEKERLVRKRVELLNDDSGSKKKANAGATESENREKEQKAVTVEMGVAGGGAEKSAHAKVKDTLRLFNKHYLHFVQEEEKRCEAAKAERKLVNGKKKHATAGKTKKVGLAQVDGKNKAKRPDLKAVSKMLEMGQILYQEKMIGAIPGVDVGHQFYSRAEMVAVGFHSHWLNGIDYMGNNYRKGELVHNEFPIAVAIVLSGMYEDDLDNAEDVIYTGQGGHDLCGNKRQIRDQVLERGNLALKNCVDQCLPVRVVRGHDSNSSYTGKVYTYDGLYKVVQYWAEKGISGFTVFKYRLRRLDGQPTMTTTQVQFTNGRVPQSVSEIRGLVCEDISGRQEDFPIPATNLVDDPPVAPTGFTYSRFMKVAKNVSIPSDIAGCNCKGSCVNPATCSCAKLNGSNFPYVHRDGGRLIEAKHVVFECGPNCGCGPGCVNRTSQRGLKFRLEVFRTPKKGWAVRSWDFIPSGSPVCEYIGVLMKTEDLDGVSENNYIFDIDCLQTMKGLEGRVRRQHGATIPGNIGNDLIAENAPEFCIDAASIGNVSRFINHSCGPNLFIQCVLSSHHDFKLARVMLFAADNIPPLQELTYDYGYVIDSVHGPDGKVKQMACYCGAADCRKRLY